MSVPSVPGGFPDPEAIPDQFDVYDVEVGEERVRYYGEPRDEKETVLRNVVPVFRERGYRLRLNYETGEHVLVATERSPGVDGIPWTNLALLGATVVTTLLAGARWYGIPVADAPLRVVEAWPFAASVLGVLAVHELGHYATSRYHDVEASLPYFIPVPTHLGTMGAVIRIRDRFPDRRALFDIGAAGPLAGLVATVVVTAVGVSLPPIDVSDGASVATQLELGYPLLIRGIAAALGEPLRYADPSLAVNPVVVGGWIGAFVTFLNLMPVGQLDGGHVTRAIVGERVALLGYAVPAALFGLAGYLFVFGDASGAAIWVLWGFLTLVFGRVRGSGPLDGSPVGRGRAALGVLTLLLGALCFTPTPVVFVG
ncbi:hypothetical protein BRC83_07260 [Halobacteriales archaeon QS_1_68_17]|nr:MAG: hypothetical protein BRC83_07260 [Halobacteriales archaeon QS_1_68_17]